MTDEEFKILKQRLCISGKSVAPDDFHFVETHISYLLLGREFAYKIKKTLKLPFLDFRSLKARKHACSQEVHLNKRLAPDMYIGVVSVSRDHGKIQIDGSSPSATSDYAVKMRRVDNQLEMDELLQKQEVSHQQINQLAKTIADFHKKSFPVNKIWKLDHLQDTYNQLKEWSPYAAEHMGNTYAKVMEDSCELSDLFLAKNIDYINERSQKKWVRDLHGDLHSRNIFLTDPPLIFDCIEFDDDLRQIDVLNEVAFFLMDLDYFQAHRLAETFIQTYLELLKNSSLENCWNEILFIYFKMYRASVRAKVLLISADAAESGSKNKYLEQAKRYLDLVKKYAGNLKKNRAGGPTL